MAGPSDAQKMASCIGDLINGREARYPRSTWFPFVVTRIGEKPASPNRQEGANTCEALWHMNHGTGAGVIRQILDFEDWYHSDVPLMANETGTKEPVYHTLHVYPPGIFSAIARQMESSHPAVDSCAGDARAHAARFGLGVAMKPSRRVLDHKKGSRDGCVIVGTGKPKRTWGPNKEHPNGVSSAGQRNFVRAGKTVHGEVEFTDSIVLPITLYQILGLSYPKKFAGTMAEIYDGFEKRWPGIHPFALSSAELATMMGLFNDPTNEVHAERASRWLRPFAHPYQWDRWSLGTIVTMLCEEQPSSTDEDMIHVEYANGEVRRATCSDGVRSTQEDQTAFEETAAYSCEKVSGGPTWSVAKPPGEEKVWSVKSNPLIGVKYYGRGGYVPPSMPVTEENDVPPTPADKPKSRGWGSFL